MKHIQADKYTVAWFKIAECVSRGEKERALGVYRLLSHSFNDDALSKQLEADIYLSCNEIAHALSLYKQSIELYEKSQRFFEAAALAEHFILLQPHDLPMRKNLLGYYFALDNYKKVHYYFQQLNSENHAEEIIIRSLEKALDFFLLKNHEKNMQEFFIIISGLNKKWHDYVCAYIKK
jgi:tetratricopeptide (TPR) repeat protein